jgi:hypothetical protein
VILISDSFDFCLWLLVRDCDTSFLLLRLVCLPIVSRCCVWTEASGLWILSE